MKGNFTSMFTKEIISASEIRNYVKTTYLKEEYDNLLKEINTQQILWTAASDRLSGAVFRWLHLLSFFFILCLGFICNGILIRGNIIKCYPLFLLLLVVIIISMILVFRNIVKILNTVYYVTEKYIYTVDKARKTVRRFDIQIVLDGNYNVLHRPKIIRQPSGVVDIFFFHGMFGWANDFDCYYFYSIEKKHIDTILNIFGKNITATPLSYNQRHRELAHDA